MKRIPVLFAMLMIVASVPASAATAPVTPESSSYTGTHVAFQAESNAVANYTVDGEPMVSSVAVQSESTVKEGLGIGLDGDLDLKTVTDIEAAGLSVGAETTTQANIETESGAGMTAHDNADGTLVVTANDSAQVVDADLAGDASAEQQSDSRVTVTTENGTKGSFIVAGDGRVTVDEEGNVTARLDEDARLVFRSAGEERSEEEEQTAQLIADGEAAAEVYVVQQGGEAVVDTVTYGSNTTVETKQTAENEVELTVERTAHDGKVVVTHVREEAVGSVENLSVTVDGEAAAKASAFSELRAATDNGSTSKYMVQQTSSASAEADAKVYVAVNHFSTRTVTMSGAGDSTTDTTSTTATDGDTTADSSTTAEDTATSGDDADDGGSSEASGSPGFGVGVASLALAGVLGVARLRR
ncbi:hypothetical protein [Haloarchaeobius sp. HME9146]|uniref:hypothetical protein n=1 Tax=Haloarchaeobius sp. HME9146 TaxID=2978732 RepID=UPI0021BF9E89|nr:hypothetical protein [Haloarchaeobius sp. HME9146]MCT9095537.1 hypothetical protein [Haloarchaeobius sp. HME9146]